MKKTLLFLLLFSIGFSVFAERYITDMIGRQVAMPEPEDIKTILTANPVASIFLYTLSYERMAGWNVNLYKDVKPLLPAAARNLPKYGTLYGNGKAISEEEVFLAHPQLILLMGDLIREIKVRADELENRFKIPVVVLDGDLNSLDKAYLLLGEICGVRDRAAELAVYCRRVIDRAEALTAGIEERDKKTVFYSLDADGLKTYPRGTSLSEYMELCGAVNVVDVPYTKKMGHMTISFEQLVGWDPQFILAGSFANTPANRGSVYNKPAWKALNAEVAVVPHLPFDIFAKPPSVNRIAGILWLQDLLYPDKVEYDLDRDMAEFNRLFYRIETPWEPGG